MTKTNCNNANPTTRQLRWWEWQQLERQGCRADDWMTVFVCDTTDLSLIRNVVFSGIVTIGALGGERSEEGLENVRIDDCSIGDHVWVRNVGGTLRGCTLQDRVQIENVARLEFEPEASCGLLCPVSVLDETGSRPVKIYPGLSAQIAWMSAHFPKWADDVLSMWLDDKFGYESVRPIIGHDAIIRDCGPLVNVRIDPEIRVEGARALRNGMIINNAPHGRAMSYVGDGVDANNFIIEDAHVDAGVLLRNCYVGQGVEVDKGFTAHDTLMFANTSLENGEACAVFAGPYTVSMHKSSLLIGCELSFMNAGSGTNQSNHMYKLGPVHWGIMQRGVKTASSSYVMWGAKIGAFSLLMGVHKNHPDASEFPFSYLFGDEKGSTTVVPGMMLRSCGLTRDEKKWPTRDRRLKRRIPLHDRINFTVLNPATVSRMQKTLSLIDELLTRGVDDDLYIRHKGMKFRASALDRAKKYYELAIAHYLHLRLGNDPFPQIQENAEDIQWVDVAGQIVTTADIQQIKKAESLDQAEAIFTQAFDDFDNRELQWIANTFAEKWKERREVLAEYSKQFLRMVEDDRTAYRRSLSEETNMLTTIE